MNNRKHFRGGAKRSSFIALFLILTMLLSSVSAFAIKKGDSLKFESDWKGDGVVFKATGDSGFKGVCAQAGIDRDPEGTAKVDKVFPNDSTTAKIAWHIYSNKWIGDKAGDTASGFDALKNGNLAMKLIQISHQGKKTWWENITGMSESTRDKIYDIYDDLKDGDPAPANFEVILMDPGNASQTFIMWRERPMGKLKLQKVNGNPNITN